MTRNGRTVRKHNAAIGALLAAATLVGPGSAAMAGNGASFHGVFNETNDGALAGLDIHGSAKMTVTADRTTVEISVSGLDPSQLYSSHLHDGTCASGGGGHYKHDDSDGASSAPPNELHVTSGASMLTPNAGGVAHGAGSAPWAARTAAIGQSNALSVVVHGYVVIDENEPAVNKRIACVDLT